ncbi:hypothetical protein pb186bvf_012112 [Paramecium bursaria]
MSQQSLKNKKIMFNSQTLDSTSYDKRTSRFLATLDQTEEINTEKAFFILLDSCQELVALHNDQNKQEIEQAIKQNQSYEFVAQLVHQKLQLLKRDFVMKEYETIIDKENNKSTMILETEDSFQLYNKLQESNLRWKSLYFQEARQLIDITKEFRQTAKDLEQQQQYIQQLETKLDYMELKYLNFYQSHYQADENDSGNIQEYVQQINDNSQILKIQLNESRQLSMNLSRRLQEELLKIQGSQELRIADLQKNERIQLLYTNLINLRIHRAACCPQIFNIFSVQQLIKKNKNFFTSQKEYSKMNWEQYMMNVEEDEEFQEMPPLQLVRRDAIIYEADESEISDILTENSDKIYECLECPICLEEEGTIPLKCGHQFCHKDINTIVQMAQTTNNIVKCPICRQYQNVKSIDELIRIIA